MIPPAVWRRIFKPYYRRIYETARQAGLVVMIHSCGNITELLPDFLEIGVQVVHAFQPEAMDVACCRREFGKDVTFWGGWLAEHHSVRNDRASSPRSPGQVGTLP